MDKKAVYLYIHGDVQGVFYRHFTKKEAQKNGLSGWVKNEHDGSVSMFVQGNSENVDKIIQWSHEGSPMSTVEKVEVKPASTDHNIKDFTVK